MKGEIGVGPGVGCWATTVQPESGLNASAAEGISSTVVGAGLEVGVGVSWLPTQPTRTTANSNMMDNVSFRMVFSTGEDVAQLYQKAGEGFQVWISLICD